MSARKEEKREKVNRRQRKKMYQKTHGYNPNEEEKIQQLIHETTKYTNQRLTEVKQERVNRTYAGFLESIKQRPKNKNRWWRRCK